MESTLVHVGYHKTGTTWLQQVWWSDPESGYRRVGKARDSPVSRLITDRGLEYDPEPLREAFDAQLRKIRRKGLLPVVSHERLSGHPFSGGYDAKEIADRVNELFPDARILIVIREQKSVIISTYKHYVRVGGPATLRRFLDTPSSVHARMAWFDYRHFEYDHLIHYYRSLCGGDERVLTLPFDFFIRDGRGFVERVAAFAGRPVPAHVLDRLPYGENVNQSPAALTVMLMRRLNRFDARADLNQMPVFELHSARRLRKRLRSSDPFSSAGRLAEWAEARLRQEVAEAVGDRYAESNRRTAELIGIDLAALGWPAREPAASPEAGSTPADLGAADPGACEAS